MQVAVCGPNSCTAAEAAWAGEVGALLAARGVTVICGGGDGVMAAVAAGARSQGGLVIGVRADDTRSGASPDLSAVLVTNMGQARNAIIVWSADAVIVIGGSWGTLSELALAKRRGSIPVVCLAGWRILDQSGELVPGIAYATTPEDAVALAVPPDCR
jgi:uncharacterized protein (TIGR00725 family)